MKIAKNIIKKAEYKKADYLLGLLHWRNTPNAIGSSPCQRLFSRRTEILIPSTKEQLMPKIVKNVSEKIKQRQKIAKKEFDKHKKPVSDLFIGQSVRTQKNPAERKQGGVHIMIGDLAMPCIDVILFTTEIV